MAGQEPGDGDEAETRQTGRAPSLLPLSVRDAGDRDSRHLVPPRQVGSGRSSRPQTEEGRSGPRRSDGGERARSTNVEAGRRSRSNQAQARPLASPLSRNGTPEAPPGPAAAGASQLATEPRHTPSPTGMQPRSPRTPDAGQARGARSPSLQRHPRDSNAGLRRRRVRRIRWQRGNLIGSGQYGSVYEALDVGTCVVLPHPRLAPLFTPRRPLPPSAAGRSWQ